LDTWGVRLSILRAKGKTSAAGHEHLVEAIGHLTRRGRALVPGQWVSTGSIVPTKFVEPGQTWRFEVAGLAPVELQAV
jgi:2-keto-4-pentenoate hydratase